MGGIVGYVGARDATPIIYEGLRRLEYRGYDSAGLAVVDRGRLQIRRDAGKLERLAALLQTEPVSGNRGIGHTRWATHGEPSARNAHPHVGATGEVVVVHNGIVENFLVLREELQAEGVRFNSDTDSDVTAHLVERYLATGTPLAEAARRAILHLKGAHGIVLLSTREPDKIIAARVGNAGGVVIGVGQGEMFVASDIPGIRAAGDRDPRRISSPDAGGRSTASGGASCSLGSCVGRKGRVQALHAEGDLRAGAVDDGHHRRTGRLRGGPGSTPVVQLDRLARTQTGGDWHPRL